MKIFEYKLTDEVEATLFVWMNLERCVLFVVHSSAHMPSTE